MMIDLNVTLIIPTFNRPDTLKITLDSYFRCKTVPNETIIVDQSNDDCFNKNQLTIKFYLEKGIVIKHIRSSIRGITSARNLGLSFASNEIIVFSDDDVVAINEPFENVVSIYKHNENISLIAGLNSRDLGLRKSIHNRLFGKFFFVSPFNSNKCFVSKGLFGRLPSHIKKTIKATWAMGFFFSVRKSCLTLTGILFDEKLSRYAYAEDLDFTLRYISKTKQKKYIAVVDPNVVLEHLSSQEFRTDKVESLAMVFINREYINWKLHGNNIFYRFCISWSNIGYKLSIKTKTNKDIIKKAFKIYKRHKKELRHGIISNSTYELGSKTHD